MGGAGPVGRAVARMRHQPLDPDVPTQPDGEADGSSRLDDHREVARSGSGEQAGRGLMWRREKCLVEHGKVASA